MNDQIVRRSSTSTPAVGSSRITTGGRCTSACAISTRRFMPPDNARIETFALSESSSRSSISSIHGQVSLPQPRSEEHTSELQSLMRISYAVFCLKKKKQNTKTHIHETNARYKHQK